MQVSFVILTHNRKAPLLRTLDRLASTAGLDAGQWEVLVVDNASTDGTAEAVASMADAGVWPMPVRLIRQIRNEGSVSRNRGVAAAEAEVVCFLDDDSSPRVGTMARAVARFAAEAGLGMLGGQVMLPCGGQDASAIPIVPPACAMVVRKRAFEAVGGFCPMFFRQAEEYDVVFKMLSAGWDVVRDESLVFDHEKVSLSRQPARIAELDLINNLLLVDRHFPSSWRRELRQSWLRRYAVMVRSAFEKEGMAGREADERIGAAIRQARALIAADRGSRGRRPMDERLVDQVFRMDEQVRALKAWRTQHDVHVVAIAGFTKTLAPVCRACKAAGLRIEAVVDKNVDFLGANVLDLPIIDAEEACIRTFMGVVVGEMSPVRIGAAAEAVTGWHRGPVFAPAI